MKRFFILLYSILLCFSFSACSKNLNTINISQVEKIILWTHKNKYELTAEDSERLIELYNASRYAGKATGEGGTPDFGVTIYFYNQTQLSVNEFAGGIADGSLFEVFSSSPFNSAFYLNSSELYSFIITRIDQYT